MKEGGSPEQEWGSSASPDLSGSLCCKSKMLRHSASRAPSPSSLTPLLTPLCFKARDIVKQMLAVRPLQRITVENALRVRCCPTATRALRAQTQQLFLDHARARTLDPDPTGDSWRTPQLSPVTHSTTPSPVAAPMDHAEVAASSGPRSANPRSQDQAPRSVAAITTSVMPSAAPHVATRASPKPLALHIVMPTSALQPAHSVPSTTLNDTEVCPALVASTQLRSSNLDAASPPSCTPNPPLFQPRF
jgi:hypothetical protein